MSISEQRQLSTFIIVMGSRQNQRKWTNIHCFLLTLDFGAATLRRKSSVKEFNKVPFGSGKERPVASISLIAGTSPFEITKFNVVSRLPRFDNGPTLLCPTEKFPLTNTSDAEITSDWIATFQVNTRFGILTVPDRETIPTNEKAKPTTVLLSITFKFNSTGAFTTIPNVEIPTFGG